MGAFSDSDEPTGTLIPNRDKPQHSERNWPFPDTPTGVIVAASGSGLAISPVDPYSVELQSGVVPVSDLIHDVSAASGTEVVLSVGTQYPGSSGPKKGSARFYEMSSNVCSRVLEVGGIVYASAFLSDYSMVALSSASTTTHSISLWNVDENGSEEVHCLGDHTDTVFRLRHREDIWPARLLSGSFDQTARIWDLHKCRSIARLDKHTFWVRGIDVSCGGDLVATGANHIRLWDSKTFELTHSHNGEVCRLMFPRHKPHLVVAGGYCSVRCLDLRKLDAPLFESAKSKNYHYGIAEIDHGRFVTSNSSGAVHIWDYNGKSLLHHQLPHKPYLSPGLCFVPKSPDETFDAVELDERIAFLVSLGWLGTIVLVGGIELAWLSCVIGVLE